MNAAFIVLALASLVAPGEEESVEALIEKIRSGTPAELPRLGHELARAGEEALALTRSARDTLPEGPPRRTLARAATWQLAFRLSPRLLAGFQSQLTFAGQYTELLEEGPEVVDAYLALLDDEATDIRVRLSAARGLADALDPKLERPEAIVASLTQEGRRAILSRLRELYHDVLFPPVLYEQVGVLLAILGDMQAVESSLQRFLRLAESSNQLEVVDSHMRLANLYYRIRDYEKAVRSYEKVLDFYEKLLAFQKRRDPNGEIVERLERELSLEYYNAACSSALNRDVERAQELLRKAVTLDPIHLDNLERDGDLLNVRQSPDFESFRRTLRDLAPRG